MTGDYLARWDIQQQLQLQNRIHILHDLMASFMSLEDLFDWPPYVMLMTPGLTVRNSKITVALMCYELLEDGNAFDGLLMLLQDIRHLYFHGSHRFCEEHPRPIYIDVSM